MEIEKIDQIVSVAKVGKSAPVLPWGDVLSISPDAIKIRCWVDQLMQMPDVRGIAVRSERPSLEQLTRVMVEELY
ncbi:MAG: hypothetical protein ACKVOH_01275 [Chlamydiales bacterium]